MSQENKKKPEFDHSNGLPIITVGRHDTPGMVIEDTNPTSDKEDDNNLNTNENEQESTKIPATNSGTGGTPPELEIEEGDSEINNQDQSYLDYLDMLLKVMRKNLQKEKKNIPNQLAENITESADNFLEYLNNKKTTYEYYKVDENSKVTKHTEKYDEAARKQYREANYEVHSKLNHEMDIVDNHTSIKTTYQEPGNKKTSTVNTIFNEGNKFTLTSKEGNMKLMLAMASYVAHQRLGGKAKYTITLQDDFDIAKLAELSAILQMSSTLYSIKFKGQDKAMTDAEQKKFEDELNQKPEYSAAFNKQIVAHRETLLDKSLDPKPPKPSEPADPHSNPKEEEGEVEDKEKKEKDESQVKQPETPRENNSQHLNPKP